jgi:hypothetical protein
MKRIPGLQNALNFYELAQTPQYETDGITPLRSSYQSSMLEWGISKLDDLRLRMPDAGGLVIAPNIVMAEYMVNLLEILEGERPVLVHSKMANPTSKISAFRNSNKRWLVSVAMVSEGVDIKRLRVLVYLPNALTELAFRQSVGRVVRTMGSHDDTRAYVVMPAFERFEMFARRVENEMPKSKRSEGVKPRHKFCGVCGSKCDLNQTNCHECGNEFPNLPARVKKCHSCGASNPSGINECLNCGESMIHEFTVTLDEALRAGAIVRGADLDENEVADAELMAELVRGRILRSGDAKLVGLIQSLPEESWSRLKGILNE